MWRRWIDKISLSHWREIGFYNRDAERFVDAEIVGTPVFYYYGYHWARDAQGKVTWFNVKFYWVDNAKADSD